MMKGRFAAFGAVLAWLLLCQVRDGGDFRRQKYCKICT